MQTPGDYLIREAKVYEILKQHPHPNICVYYVSVTVITSPPYVETIWTYAYERSFGKRSHLDPAAILDGISDGLTFLHGAFGLVHNDISRANIVLDGAGDPVIIDFDSAYRLGMR